MNLNRHDHHQRHRRGLVKFLFFGILAAFALAFVIHFSWNMVIPDILHAPELSFRNSVGLVGLVLSLGALLCPGHFRHLRGGTWHSVANKTRLDESV